jgi:hypothetical protein
MMRRLALELHFCYPMRGRRFIRAKSPLNFRAKRLQKLGIMCTGSIPYVKQNYEVISLMN